jgi:hypothetical protein
VESTTAITGEPVPASRVQAISSAARALPWVIVALLTAGVASTFAPWVRTGAARRTSYEAVRSAARLDLVEGTGAELFRVLWPFVPLVACLAILAIVLERPRLGALLGGFVGLALVTFAVLVSRVPDLGDWGVTAGLLLGGSVVATSIPLLTVRPGAPHDHA